MSRLASVAQGLAFWSKEGLSNTRLAPFACFTDTISSVASISELREQLRKPLELELRSGCQDNAVVGGLEKLLGTLGKPFADIRELMQGYADLAPQDRALRIDQALDLLDADMRLPAQTQTQAQDLSSNEPQGKVKGGDAVELSVLDRELTEKVIDLGAQAPRKLSQIGLKSYRDLLYHYPRRYEDRRVLPYFAGLQDQNSVTVAGVITGRKAVKSRRGMVVLRAFLEDQLGAKLAAVWFNQPWLEKQLFPGQRIIVSGKVKRRGRQIDINVAHHEIDDDSETLSTGRIVGVYPSTQGLSQAYIRRAVYRLLEAIKVFPDHLPKSVLQRYELLPFDMALREVHFPSDEKLLQRALRRLKFDEFLFLELRVLLNRDTSLLGKHFKVRQPDLEVFTESLPFSFTAAQQRALDEILADMSTPRQMARLLQGDVGSGKTAVAAAAAFVAIQNGFQVALMAPTEILARQHYLNLIAYLYPLGVQS